MTPSSVLRSSTSFAEPRRHALGAAPRVPIDNSHTSATRAIYGIAAVLLGLGSVALLCNFYALVPSHLDALIPLGMFYLAIALTETLRGLHRGKASLAAGVVATNVPHEENTSDGLAPSFLQGIFRCTPHQAHASPAQDQAPGPRPQNTFDLQL